MWNTLSLIPSTEREGGKEEQRGGGKNKQRKKEEMLLSVPKSAASAVGQIPILVKTVTKPPQHLLLHLVVWSWARFCFSRSYFLYLRENNKAHCLPKCTASLVFPGWGMPFSFSVTVWSRPQGLTLDLFPSSILPASNESSQVCLLHLLNIPQSTLAAVRHCRVYLIRGSCPRPHAPRVYTVPAFARAVQDIRDARMTASSQGAS